MKWCPYCIQETKSDSRFCPSCGASLEDQNQSSHLQVGTLLENGQQQYRIGRVLGSGGFGVTYLARRMKDQKIVAIKEYDPVICAQRMPDGSIAPKPDQEQIYEGGRYNFLKEAMMIASLEGLPSIVQGLDYMESNNTAYLVMEYLNGIPLFRIIRQQGRMNAEQLLPPMRKLMLDIAKLHDKGILHRDISPDNIMLMPDGTLKLLDFGSARSMENGKSMTVALKKGFAPIEQYQTHGQGPYTDVYALCATIYYCLTGTIPPESTARALSGAEIEPIASFGVALTEDETAALMWGLALAPKDRPQNMRQLAEAFHAVPVTSSEPVKQVDPITPTPARLSLWQRIKAWLGLR